MLCVNLSMAAATGTQAGVAAEKIAQRRIRRLGERQHRSERVGQRAELARADHCCAMVSSMWMLSSRASTVARALESRILTAT